MNDQLDPKTAFKETLPTVFGYLGIGLAYGIVGKAAGFSAWIVLLSSLIIYAGSAQFITVSMMTVSSPILSVVFATFLVNSRMILMSTTLSKYFKRDRLWKNIVLGSLLTDESFAVGMNKLNYTDGRLSFGWFNTVNVIAYLTWSLASLLGALLGSFVPEPNKLGLDFALVAMFIGLLYLQVIANITIARLLQLIIIFLTLVLTYFGMAIISSQLLVLVVTLVVCGIGVVIKHAFFA